MRSDVTVGLDIGTSSVRAQLFEEGAAKESELAQREYSGEHDPDRGGDERPEDQGKRAELLTPRDGVPVPADEEVETERRECAAPLRREHHDHQDQQRDETGAEREARAAEDAVAHAEAPADHRRFGVRATSPCSSHAAPT